MDFYKKINIFAFMKAILFLKTKQGQYLFKGDSFWSKGVDPDYAKVYSDDDINQVNDWLRNGLFPWNIYKNKIDDVIKRYHDGILGYFTPSEDKYDGPHNIKKGTTIEELGKPTYLWVSKMKPFDEWIIEKEDDDSITPKSGTIGYFEDYTQYHRDEILTDVLNKKDSD